MPEKTRLICDEAFDAIFDACDKQKLYAEIHRQHKNTYTFLVSGGFKVTAQTLVNHQKRLRLKLPSLGTEAHVFPQVAAQGDGPWKSIHDLLKLLTEDAVESLAEDLMLSAARPLDLALALYLFPKDSIQHKKGLDLMARPELWTRSEKTPENPILKQCPDLFPGLFDQVRPQQPETDRPALTSQQLQEQLDKEYRRGKNDQLQANAQERKKNSVELKETQRRLKDAQEQLEQLQKRMDQQKKQADLTLQEETARLEKQFRQAQENFLSQTLGVDHQLQYDAVNAQQTTDGLLKQIAEATAAQRDLNLNHGSKAALRQQESQLRQALDTLCQAANDSFVTVKNLNTIISQTNAQILRIHQKLEDPEATSLACTQLGAYISSIPLDEQGERRLRDAQDFLLDALNHELLQDQEMEHLQHLVEHRLNLLKRMKLKPLEKHLAAMPSQKPNRGPAEIMYLSKDLPRLKRVTLIFDGYNAMKRNPLWSNMEQEHCLEVARKHFIKTIRSKLKCFQRIELIFDGTGTTITHEKISDDMRITYSAHINDEHNADDFIVQRAEELRKSNQADLIWVVTNDYELRTRLESTCNAFVETSAIPRFFLS